MAEIETTVFFSFTLLKCLIIISTRLNKTPQHLDRFGISPDKWPQRWIPVVLHQCADTKDRFLKTKKAAYITKRKIQSSLPHFPFFFNFIFLNWLLKSVQPKISDQASQIRRSCRRTIESAFKKRCVEKSEARRPDNQLVWLTGRTWREHVAPWHAGSIALEGLPTLTCVERLAECRVTKTLGTHLEFRTSALRAWINSPCQVQGEHGGCA